MRNETSLPEIFKHGATWLRADFHLHTKADKEFHYLDAENDYVSQYVDSLAGAGIRVGVITNHNKFDVSEFKALQKRAKKEEIFLLPGVELSVNDGLNGVHTLIIFNDEWLTGGRDYINQFLNVAFEGKMSNQYEQENGRSSLDLLSTLKRLEGYNKDFFIVFAHVEQKNGLWNAFDGGRLQELGQNDIFRRRSLGFQKVRTHDKSDKVCRTKVKGWFGGWYPAELEGSDCKSISEIGKGSACYLKLGAFSFDAVKFALMDHDNRVLSEPLQHKHSHIRSIRFTGGTLKDTELHFSPELNTLIGIRGSGKSSVLEVLRYALDIPFGEKSGDQKYKQDLVGFTLGSGGKVEVDAVDRYGQLYTIRRVWKESHPDVVVGGQLQPGVSIRETVLHKPIYFGQKDLSSTGDGFERDLVDKLLGAKLDGLRRSISQQKQKVTEAVDRLLKISTVPEQLAEQKKIKQDTEYRLNFYKAHGVEEKLQKRLSFDTDVRMIHNGIQLTTQFVSDLEGLLAQHEDNLRNFRGYHSKHNEELFNRFYQRYESYVSFIETAKTWLASEKSTRQALMVSQTELVGIRKGMVEEFAEIERKLADDLRSSQSISSDEFLNLTKKLAAANQLISALEKSGDQEKLLKNQLFSELLVLNKLWLEEFNSIQNELDRVGAGSTSISIRSEFKENKGAFLSFMKEMFKGSGIRETTYQGLVDKYRDFIDIYKDFENAKRHFGSQPHMLADLFLQHLKILLTFQTPNKFTILYREKELQHHSLGQRASALILFVLSQKENDVIIIDQPEDDLDNQTIYEDVIKLIRQMKPEVQFIFATHNPNIPVLGDAEQVHACSFMDDKETVISGSVDNQDTQKTIVKIMEGGKEAFDRRKEIYQIWKP